MQILSSALGSLLVNFVATPLASFIGDLNCVYLAIFVQGARLLVYSLVM